MHKKFEINRTKIKGDCQSGRKVVTHNSMNDLPLTSNKPKINDSIEHGKEHASPGEKKSVIAILQSRILHYK